MRTLTVYAAQPIREQVVPTTVVIDTPIPERMDTLVAAHLFQDQGSALAEALWSSLPVGTVAVLIAALLTHRASLRVRFPEPAPGGAR